MKLGHKAPAQEGMKTEGEARIEGAKRPRIEGEARIEGKARDKSGGGVWGGGSVSPSPEICCKIDSEMVQSGAYFTQKLPDLAISLICPDSNCQQESNMGSLMIELNRHGRSEGEQGRANAPLDLVIRSKYKHFLS